MSSTDEASWRVIQARQAAQLAVRRALQEWDLTPGTSKMRAAWQCERRRLTAAAKALALPISLAPEPRGTYTQTQTKAASKALTRQTEEVEKLVDEAITSAAGSS
jgi:hypothetical protein